ncbi:MAG TPA: substrate-binding domain-containing protein, partial [Candidatus Deferrimicrobium sp.]|nr:substrate-binding domain-containing protein [Candidatus Deferrimicrobium sp.]
MEGSLALNGVRRRFFFLAAAVLAALLASGSRGLAAEAIRISGTGGAMDTIRISGTGGAMDTMRILGEAFRKRNPGIRIEMPPGMGSSGGIKAVLAGRLEIGLSARPRRGEERDQGAVDTRYAKTPFVFAVNRSLKMTGMTLESVAGIYAGKRDWEGGKRIRLVLRSPEDTDITVLKGMSPEMSAAVDIALRRAGMIVATTDQEAIDAIETVPGAFGGTTLSLLLSRNHAVRVLALDGVVPSVRS